MAKNTGRNSRLGAVKAREQVPGANATWIHPDAGTGMFLEAKVKGGLLRDGYTPRHVRRAWWQRLFRVGR